MMSQLTEINVDDLNKLSQLRMERIIGLFPSSLPFCLIQIDTDNVLSIHCHHAGIMDRLIAELEDLCYYACLIVGVRSISLNSLHKEILRADAFVF
jgi:hypothetical protein